MSAGRTGRNSLFGIGVGAIGDIKSGRNWGWLTGKVKPDKGRRKKSKKP